MPDQSGRKHRRLDAMNKIGLGRATILNVDYSNLRGRAEIFMDRIHFLVKLTLATMH
jgi:hypothetical protein